MIGRKPGWSAAVAVAGIASSAASAQANLKIGVINVARLVEQSPQLETVQKKLEEEFGPRQRDITAMQTAAAHSARDVPARCARHGRSGAAQSRAADSRRAARATAHGERVPRGLESAAQRRARRRCSARCCRRRRSMRARRSSTCCSPIRASSSPARPSTSPRPCSRFEAGRGGAAARGRNSAAPSAERLSMAATLGELAAQFGCELQRRSRRRREPRRHAVERRRPMPLRFSPTRCIERSSTRTRAAAVIVAPRDRDACPVASLVHAEPYLTYARIATSLHPPAAVVPGVHSSAVVAASARVAASAQIDAHAVVGSDCTIGEDAVIGAGTVLGANVAVGNGTRIGAASHAARRRADRRALHRASGRRHRRRRLRLRAGSRHVAKDPAGRQRRDRRRRRDRRQHDDRPRHDRGHRHRGRREARQPRADRP